MHQRCTTLDEKGSSVADLFPSWERLSEEVCYIADDLPEDYNVWYLVDLLDALFQARQTYPSGWWGQTRYNLSD